MKNDAALVLFSFCVFANVSHARCLTQHAVGDTAVYYLRFEWISILSEPVPVF